MILGFNPPRISYVGPHSSYTFDPEIKSQIELVELIICSVQYNIDLNLSLTCLDFSEIKFSPDFFQSELNEEKSEIAQTLTFAQEIIARSGTRICLIIPKNYFLGSQISEVADKTSALISKTSEVLDALGIKYPSIVIRVGSAYGNRKKTLSSFCDSLKKLGKDTISRVSVMNDDKPSLFSTTDLLTGVYYEVGVPLTFRLLPHQFNDGGLSIREALFLSCSTWDDGCKPIFIYSESLEYDTDGIPVTTKPSPQITKRIPTFGLNMDVIIDSSSKEDACLGYLMEYKSLPPIVINKVNSK